MKKIFTVLICVILMSVFVVSPLNVSAVSTDLQPTQSLVLYTSASTTEYELIVGLFKEKYPDVEVEIVSAGTGELASKIVAEAANPQGDVLMGGGTSSYSAIADYLDEYVSPNLDSIFEEFKPPVSKWTPVYINVNSIIVNNKLINELGVTVDGWESLINEKLKGNIAFADPSASASALEQLVNMLTAMSTTDSPDGGWDFVKKFLINLDGKISSSSSACYKSVVEGEYAVGLTNEDKAISYIAAGADVSVVYPKEGITLRTSNIGVIKNGPNTYNAQLFIDFVTSQECQKEMESKLFVRPARKDVPMTTKGRITTDQIKSLPYPTEWVEANSENVKVKFQDLLTSIQ
ncbi:MAG TPA: extracellular solute-binding protein [Flexilinea sp.]|nr:extracellular solute-binding protein [Flexilinea sp.]